MEAVKLGSPAILLAGIEPMPGALSRALQRPEREPGAPARSTPSAPAIRQPPPAAQQLSLIEPENADLSESKGPSPSDPPPAPSTAETSPALSAPIIDPRPIRLKAPMRLNPAVRLALQEAVDTLNDPPAASPLFTVREGVFVPLAEFERRGVQPAVALRSLVDVGLLYRPDHVGPPTTSRDVRGVPTVGVILSAMHVEGFDPAAFADSSIDADQAT